MNDAPAETPVRPVWCIMPVVSNAAMTEAAISDLLAQSVPTVVLVILQGVEIALRDRFLAIAEQEPRVLVWDHNPPLPSLSATWNCGLRAAWAAGGTEALVVNNDVRLRDDTIYWLQRVVRGEMTISDGKLPDAPLFVSAVGVDEISWKTGSQIELQDAYIGQSFGGPDFSCFLIAKAGHEKYPFDEHFIPAFCEDCSTHREYMLNGDGERIFSINLPYWHIGGGSNTLKSMSAEQRAKHERAIEQSRRYYEWCWGGPPNAERYTIKGDPRSAQDGVTNPELQRAILQPAAEA